MLNDVNHVLHKLFNFKFALIIIAIEILFVNNTDYAIDIISIHGKARISLGIEDFFKFFSSRVDRN